MQTFSRFFLALLLAVAAVGCDSNEEDAPDSERILGTWVVVEASDGRGDQTATLDRLGQLSIEFVDANDFVLTFEAADPADDQTQAGTYLLEETSNQVTLNLTYLGQVIPLALDYTFLDDDELQLTMSSTLVVLLNSLLGSDFQGNLVLTLERS